jgi:hypothetical protein
MMGQEKNKENMALNVYNEGFGGGGVTLGLQVLLYMSNVFNK